MTLSVKVLLVEDEALISAVLEDVLTEAGYEVATADDGTLALAQIEANAANFRAVVTDIRLGSGTDGWELAQRVREMVPNMPIVYMSGDSTHEWASKGVPGSLLLAKPFAPAQLVTAVSNLVTEATLHAPPPADPETGPDR
jgi:DNA-binding NtrC family response regulator